MCQLHIGAGGGGSRPRKTQDFRKLFNKKTLNRKVVRSRLISAVLYSENIIKIL